MGKDSDTRKSYVLEGWPTKEVQREGTPACLPFSDLVRTWCQAGKKVRVTFEVVDPIEEKSEASQVENPA
jgi:hypothetical protein